MFNMFSLNMKKFLRWTLQGSNAPFLRMVPVLEVEAEGRRVASFASNFATSDAPHFREAGKEQG